MTDLTTIFELILNALFVGLGSALGSYLANKGLIAHLEKFLNKMNKNGNNN